MPPRLEEFVANVAVTGLVSPDELRAARAQLPLEPAEDAATRMATLLVDRGALTSYQARKILGGATKGFLLGGCRILKPLGEGGMGKVFLARRGAGSNAPLVALKVLPPRKALADSQALARFQRETDLSRRINHPNVARTLDFGSQDGVHYMVLEFVPGDSLYHMVKAKGGPWRVPDAVRYFLQVLDGLGAAHAAGLVHRDLKPSNLMVTPDGQAKVLDLGLARALEEAGEARLTRPNIVVGTLDYASPEQISNAAGADARSDIYSLGCTIYFTLAGRPPFEGGDAINKIYKQRMEDPALLERVAKGIPPAFAAVVRKMMAKDPADRHQSAAEVRDDLRRWIDPAVVKALVGDDAEAAHAFRPPPPEVSDEDIKLIDLPSSPDIPTVSTLRDLGSAEPSPAPRNPPPPQARPARFVPLPADEVEATGYLPPRLDRDLDQGDGRWAVRLAMGISLLAILALVLFAFLRR